MSEDIRHYITKESLGNTFSDVAGRDFWKKILSCYYYEETVNEALELESVQCLLLYGPVGSGKNQLIQAMAGEMEAAGYQYLEINMEIVPSGQMAALLEHILKDYLSNSPCYLLVQHIEYAQDADLWWEFWNKAMEGQFPLILAAVTEDETLIRPEIRKMFQTYYIGLPDESDRREYFRQNMNRIFKNLSIHGMKLLVDGTEGYNYMQLESVVKQIKLCVKFQIVNQEKDIVSAKSWLEAGMVEEVLAKGQLVPTGRNGLPEMDMSALVQAVSAAQPVKTEDFQEAEVQKKTVGEDKEKPDLLSGLNPEDLFDVKVSLIHK
jgi:hypothetical protein